MKIRNKITLLFTVLVTFILLVLNISVYYITSAEREGVFRKRLKSRASNNAQLYEYFGDSSISMLTRIDASALALLARKSVSIYDTTGKLKYSYRAMDAGPLQVNKELIADVINSNEQYFKDHDREGIALYYDNPRNRFIIFVAAYDEEGLANLSQLRKVLIVSLLFAMLITIITGYIFSSELVRPIKDIIKTVNEISSHNLSRKLPTGRSQDELNQLAKTFNDLLGRLQESFATQSRFISNASHELSTPLTSISSQLQVTLQKPRSIAEYQQVLQSIQEDVDQMNQLTKRLLEIAKTSSQGSVELSELRIDELLLKVIADVQRIHADYQANLEFENLPEDERECLVYGNPDLLYSAFRNIIENGCKYSPNHTSAVKISFSQEKIVIEVINEGDVISEQEITQIFQPFFRGSNVMENPGFGLGLPLAKRIIALHKGEILVTSDTRHTTFAIILPSAPYERSRAFVEGQV